MASPFCAYSLVFEFCYNCDMKFLHISDVHLGCTRYQIAESPRDFFNAWIDVIQKYGIGENVDFVIMCGDFFHKRTVPPETMDHAVAGLTLLKEHGIPVIAIEGNHDQKHLDSSYSWLRSLAKWKLLKLLEPRNVEGKMILEPWNEELSEGGFVDVGRARIFGSHWYGASANWAVPALTKAVRANRREGAFHMLLLHTDVEGHQTHPLPALTAANLKELKEVTDYVGLGHTHMHFEIDNWAFNPGSLEVTSIDEYKEVRGAFVVDVSDDNEIAAKHVRDYTQRPFQRLSFDVSRIAEPAEIPVGVLNLIEREGKDSGGVPRIIEIILRGHLGFPNALLDLKTLREEALSISGALHVRIKNHTVPVDYAVAADVEDDASREKLERRVIKDLIARDNRYKLNSEIMADTVIGAKRLAMTEGSPEEIVNFITEQTAPILASHSTAEETARF
jgi:DNA repair protein SbcD/Mre11